MKRLLFLTTVLAIWANSAGAAVFVTWSGTALESPGIWDWTYQVTLQPDQTMREGDFATIYDVPNIAHPPIFNPTFGVGPGAPGRTFLITTPFQGQTPGAPPELASDDPNILNVSLRLISGGDVVGDPTTTPLTIGTLHIKSTSDVPLKTDYLTIAEAGGGDSITSGSVVVAVPEPGSLTLMFVGLVAAGGLAYRRRQI